MTQEKKFNEGDIVIRIFRRNFIGDNAFFRTANFEGHEPGMPFLIVDTTPDEYGRGLVMHDGKTFRYNIPMWFATLKELEEDPRLAMDWTEKGTSQKK